MSFHRGRGHGPRHPPGLKGRAIGLFYRNLKRNKEPSHEERRVCQGPSISLSERTLAEINRLLQKYHAESDDAEVCREFEKRFHDLLQKNFDEFVCSKDNTETKLGKNPPFNEKLRIEFEEQKNNPEYNTRLISRGALPASQQKDLILGAIQKNQIVLVVGSTGCGKTTQIPQIILDYCIESNRGSMCQIVCTQPRRISAITVAERVAYERNENLGKSVGYQIRLQSVMPRNNGSILYCTTGTLLRRMESDPLLFELTHIILDEIHERSIETDMLMGLLKMILPHRPDLKVILMSATVSQHHFQQYFTDCFYIKIQGTLFNVQPLYLEDVVQETGFRKFDNFKKPFCRGRPLILDQKQMDFNSMIEPYIRTIKNKYDPHVIESIRNPSSEEINIELITDLIFYICEKKPAGAILVFLPGYDKISKLNTALLNSNHFCSSSYNIYTLHSMMPTVDQKTVFQPPPLGKRKIILSTNIAETSVTIDDVVYVINSGKIKCNDFDLEHNMQTLQEKWVSLANAHQRRGRAGRVQPGICYNLYTRARERLFDAEPTPEILRSKLEGIILNLKLLHINDVAGFMSNLLDCPNEKAIENGIQLLKRINAIDANEIITPLGLHLARLPVDPQIGKMILMGALFRCLDPITTVASAIAFKDPFYKPLGKEDIVNTIRRFMSLFTQSDHLLIANVMNKFCKAKEHNTDRNFCNENFLSHSTMSQLDRMKQQFCDLLKSASFIESADGRAELSNKNCYNLNLIRAVITAGLYPNVAYLKSIKQVHNLVMPIVTMSTPTDRRVNFHPSSINALEVSFESRYFVYYMKQKTKQVYLMDSTMIYPMALIMFGDGINCYLDENESYVLSLADFFFFKSDKATNEVILQLRHLLGLLLQKKALYPSPIDFNSKDEILINAIKTLFSEGDVFDFNDDLIVEVYQG